MKAVLEEYEMHWYFQPLEAFLCFSEKYGLPEMQGIMTKMCYIKPVVSPNYPKDVWKTTGNIEVGDIIKRRITSEYCAEKDEIRLIARCFVMYRSNTAEEKVFPPDTNGFMEACKWLTEKHKELVCKHCL